MANKKIDYYNPGDLIYSGRPFISCIRKSVHKHICGHCFSRRGTLKFCGCCRVTKYCSRNCQKRDWNDHRFECKLLKNLPDDELEDFIQFVGKVIMKVKDKDWTLITEQIGNKIVSFADLISHTDALDSNPKLRLFFKESASKLKKYIGEENVPQEDKLFEIIGKVKFNSYTSRIPLNACGFDILAPYTADFAELHSLFIGLSKLDHSCIPNTFMAGGGGSISRLLATKKIRKDEELTVNYFLMVCQIYPKSADEAVKEFFFGDCKCSDCSLPYGTSILTKIIDETKAHSVIKRSENALELCSIMSLFQGDPRNMLHLREDVKILLKEQEGVLGNTNILRLRLLAWKCFQARGPPEEQLEDLEKLAEYVELAFGENYRELILIYFKLIDVCKLLLDCTRIRHYMEKLCRLRQIFFHDDEPVLDTRKFILLLQGFQIF